MRAGQLRAGPPKPGGKRRIHGGTGEKGRRARFVKDMVRKEGFEPPRPLGHKIPTWMLLSNRRGNPYSENKVVHNRPGRFYMLS